MQMGVTAESTSALLARAERAKAKGDFESIAALAEHVPSMLDATSVRLADEVAFALGRLGRYRESIPLLLRAWNVEPTWRRASALAYQHYEAMLCSRGSDRDGALEREEARDGFRTWIARALELRPASVVDLYRLGVFEAQIESKRDKPALRAFLAAIAAYRDLPQAARTGTLTKAYVKALYAGARSALRLGQVQLARRLAFACIRADARTDYVAPMHRLDMAGRACVANGQLDHAERAFRLALDAKGPPRRLHLYARLADVAARRGDLDEARRWIEAHSRAEQRPAWLWRQLGDLQRRAGALDEALASFHAAVLKDRNGKHLTWTRIAEIHAERGELGRAERTFRKAVDFARKRWSKEHRPALEGLATVLKRRGKVELAERLLAGPSLARCTPHDVHSASSRSSA